jgi:hypothetical protein
MMLSDVCHGGCGYTVAEHTYLKSEVVEGQSFYMTAPNGQKCEYFANKTCDCGCGSPDGGKT